MVSTMPRAVSGFTKHEAAWAGSVPSGIGRQSFAGKQRYWPYISPASSATVRPRSAWAASEEPAATTTPAPSLPTGRGWSRRAAIARIAGGGTSAVTTGSSAVPDARAVVMSAPPNRSPRSEGLIGDASTRTSTSSGPGSGVGTRVRLSSRVASLRTVERSWRKVSGLLMAIYSECRGRGRSVFSHVW